MTIIFRINLNEVIVVFSHPIHGTCGTYLIQLDNNKSFNLEMLTYSIS